MTPELKTSNKNRARFKFKFSTGVGLGEGVKEGEMEDEGDRESCGGCCGVDGLLLLGRCCNSDSIYLYLFWKNET